MVFFVIEEAKCEDKISDQVTCSVNPLTGQPSSCADIPLAATHYNITIATVCKWPIAEIECSGGGTVEDHCPKTCSACSKYVFVSLNQNTKIIFNTSSVIRDVIHFHLF